MTPRMMHRMMLSVSLREGVDSAVRQQCPSVLSSFVLNVEIAPGRNAGVWITVGAVLLDLGSTPHVSQ